MTIFIDGDFNMVEAQKFLLTKIEALDEAPDVIECLRDKVKYHAPKGVPYASTIGMTYEDPETGEVETFCIGCFHCEYGARTHEGNDRAQALIEELRLNDPAKYGLTSDQ